MSFFLSLFRNPGVLGALNATTFLGLGGSTYLLRSHMIELSEDHEARMDELEGTLRGHIGLIEEALDRLEGKATEADRGKKMNEYYGKRARDERTK
ncbi:histone acetyltransferase subunit (Yaf9) [Drepanopeziza brunnea f. sp. 'multigermtubi' MB_m1]|uniref:Histone acetyltransferase subunit (Yaf9) n=1 Tax=Marssonina brunnea f. sp. multigermtubi (strain MB_m1) TaxID=1072389 RepID=K1X0C0_MARBU|nr:histone acetyltransferase subunit (Yaf9) [Drepanopeziza brunnea f. sp. 'multigermtubi' MB_m1]EKD14323.1 histone acetyltransferase subunit (Yaf9) [Drepanopeziza brunnea f. sp. 'multigermtubi' MB_m1]